MGHGPATGPPPTTKQLRAIVESPGFRRQFGRLEGERLQLVAPFTCRLLRTGLRGLNKAESIVSTHHRGGTKSRLMNTA